MSLFVLFLSLSLTHTLLFSPNEFTWINQSLIWLGIQFATVFSPFFISAFSKTFFSIWIAELIFFHYLIIAHSIFRKPNNIFFLSALRKKNHFDSLVGCAFSIFFFRSSSFIRKQIKIICDKNSNKSKLFWTIDYGH